MNLEFTMFYMDKEALQQLIDDLFSDENENAERVYEYYIVTSKRFRNAIDMARETLRLTNTKGLYKLADSEVLDFVVEHLNNTNKPISKRHRNELLKQYYDVINEVIEKTDLPIKWRNYIAISAVTNLPPKTNVFPPHRYVSVELVSKDSVSVKIKNGIRYDEYVASWKVLAQQLGKGRRKTKLPDEMTSIRDSQMYGKREFYKTTQSDLAKEYISKNIDISDATDTVKKALKRQRKLHDKGTDLAK